MAGRIMADSAILERTLIITLPARLRVTIITDPCPNVSLGQNLLFHNISFVLKAKIFYILCY